MRTSSEVFAPNMLPTLLMSNSRAFASSAGPESPNSKTSSARGPSANKAPAIDSDEDYGEIKRGADNVQFTWRSTMFTCLVAGGCLLYYDYLMRNREDCARAVVRHERIGTPKLGGPFELIDRKGVPRTDEDF